jgi:hypothetical protein
MTQPTGGDPLDEFARADPADPERSPSASLARVRARVQEITDTEKTYRRPMRLAAGAAFVTAAGLVLALVAVPRAAAPGAAPTPSGGAPIIGSCVEQYSPANLANRDFAFDGTVVTIEGDEVTFTVNSPYRGVDGTEVTLTAEGMTGTAITSGGGPTLVEGARYLVAGDEAFVWGCGFTQPYDPAVAAVWEAALGA